MNVLQLFFNDGPTSMPYNELCIGLRKNINQFIVILDSSISKKKYPSIKNFLILLLLLDREFVIEALGEADIFISLSKGEGMPLAVLEAMGAGCYTILSDIPSHKEVNPPNLTCSFLYLDNNLKNIIDEIISIGKEKINEGGQS